MRYFLFTLILFLRCTTLPEDVPGCTNSNACNFNPEANEDDGSCSNKIDCRGLCGGVAYVDPCGYCDDDFENDCLLECTEIKSAYSIEDVEFPCDGDYTEAGYYCSDLEVLRDFISINPASLHIMDKDGDKIITPLEFGVQIWSSDGRLESLDLNYHESVTSICSFRLDSLPDNIGALDSLKTLILTNNEITILPESIGDLGILEKLLLESNRLTTFPESIGNLKNLEFLYAHHNQIIFLPSNFFEMTNLQVLWLHFNNLSFLPDNLGDMINLVQLYLHNNQIEEIPSSIGELESLEWIRLEYNQLNTLPDEICDLGVNSNGGLTIGLSISDNKTCPIYPACVDKILGYQNCEDCESGFLIGDGSDGVNGNESECLNIRDWQALQDIIDANDVYFGLRPVDIVDFSFWSKSGESNRLIELILDGKGLTGKIPESIGNLDNLKKLHLQANSFIGDIPSSIGNLHLIQEIRLNDNQLGCFEYDASTELCITYCDDSNGCSGKLPDNITTLAKLEILNLKSNYLTQIPEGMNNLIKLKKLKLRFNLIQGKLPLEIFDITTLTWLDVSRNQFTGTIPDNINELQGMTNLYFSNNQLSGIIPESICELESLNQVHFNRNQFCPPYPECLTEENIGYQSTSLCAE